MLSAWRLRTCETENYSTQCGKTGLKLQQGCAKAKGRQLPDDRPVRRRSRKGELHQARAEAQEKAALSANEEARQVASERRAGLLGHWVHAGRTPMLAMEKPQCGGGHPVQEWSEPMKARGKG